VGDEGGRASVGRDLQSRARERTLAHRIERVERRLARLSAALDGASVTLVPVAERLRPPSGPDPALQLQRIAGSRRTEDLDDDR
jgi:hypothetical protein